MMNSEEALQFVESLLAECGKRLNDTQRAVFRGAWLDQSYKEIHRACPGRSLEHIMQNVGPELWKLLQETVGEGVSKKNLKGPIDRAKTERMARHLIASKTVPGTVLPALAIANGSMLDTGLPEAVFPEAADDWHDWSPTSHTQPDWGTAPDTALFCGRKRDLTQLAQWIQIDGCRLLTLFGMGGIGKTMLAVRLAQRLKDQFEYLIWRSLDRPMPLPELIFELTQFLSTQADAASSDPADLLHCLKQQRCLVLLDGWDRLMRGGVHDGSYEAPYQAYGEFLTTLGQTYHQSCVLITSREKPKEVMGLEGGQSVKSWQLKGLSELGDEFFRAQDLFSSSANDWRSLTRRYDGNPLALRIAASYIRDVFSGDVAAFLAQFQANAVGLGEVAALLEHQFDRLSALERTVVQCLADQAEPITFTEILQTVAQPLTGMQLQEVLQSLRRRALIEIASGRYSLPDLMREYAVVAPASVGNAII